MITPSFLVLLYTMGALAAPAPAPATPKPASKGFHIEAHPNPNFRRNGRGALYKVLTKYHLPIPSGLQSFSAMGDGDGNVDANPADQDVEYTCPVTIGGQNFNLDFDSGSSDLWVISNLLSNTGSHNVYNPKKSKTYKKLTGATWKISYGDGSGASGVVATDTVQVGDISVTGQAVELANKISDQFLQDTANDGLLGLALDKINTVKPKQQATFLTQAKAKGAIDKAIFAADLRHQEKGSYIFGSAAIDNYSGDLKTISVDSSQGFWQFDTGDFFVGKTRISGDGTPGIADTGTTLVLVTSAIAKAYYKQVKGAKLDSQQGGYVFPCTAKVPDLTLSFGQDDSDSFVVPGSLINFAPTDDTGKTCFGGVQGSDGLDVMIYGDIFFKAAYTVFNKEEMTFAFGPKA